MNILFLCSGNSCRSILAEACFNQLAPDGWHATSAGSHPTGCVHPQALERLTRAHIDTCGLHSKSWNDLTKTPDIVITVCSNAAAETCPIYLGQAMRAHWGVEDPAAIQESSALIEQAFDNAYQVLHHRISALFGQPLDALANNPACLKAELDRIGKLGPPMSHR